MIVVKYEAEHMMLLDLQEGQQYLAHTVGPREAKALENEYSFTGMSEDGHVLIVAGLIKMWPGRYLTWAYLDRTAGRYMLAITRRVEKLLALHDGARIEATVDADFAPGHRWVQMLGFELETPRMRQYRPDGGDCAMYVRIRK